MPEYWIDGRRVEKEDALADALTEAQEYMISKEFELVDTLGVTLDTASAILYLRSRSRWTPEKEQELIDRDLSGDPISLGKILGGVF